MTEKNGVEAARSAAEEYLRAQGYEREADLVAEGKGDEFQEVRLALSLWRIMNPRPVGSPPTKRYGRRIAGEEV